MAEGFWSLESSYEGSPVGALIDRIGFLCLVCYSYDKEAKTVPSKDVGPYITPAKTKGAGFPRWLDDSVSEV